MKTPLATYRIQLNREFDFLKLKKIVPYLAKLGISHIYASPIFKARAGSTHGYDIVDPTEINAELGGRAAFEELKRENAAYGLDWLQDIVPNHAAYSLENKRVSDVLQHGPDSRYHKFFDVDWSHPSTNLKGRILVPFLGKELVECIKKREITLVHDEFSVKIRYDSLDFPVNRMSIQELSGKEDVGQTVKRVNDDPAVLKSLLSKQFYSLMYWRDAFKEINYRRFFDILDLIGLRMEEPTVFEETHQLIFNLLNTGKIGGLRVDHVDGIYNPEEYLLNLRRHAPDAYLLVEKILTDNETLPESWPIQGNTGYDFVNFVNRLFVKQTNETAIDNIYKNFTENTQDFEALLFDCKNLVINNYFMGDLRNIARLANQTLQKLGYNQFDSNKMPLAIAALIACFPVYRTYLNSKNPIDKKGYFKAALKQAKQRKHEYAEELGAIEFILHQCHVNRAALNALMRLQQFTGAVMAKGLEDTTFYRYCRFISLNEVGGDPAKFGGSTEEFHQFNLARQMRWPLTLNASSTHDTKRGEDARARLNVLSEVPQELEKRISNWAEINVKHKTYINGWPAPNRNEEYLIYQSILGSFPFETTERDEFIQRTASFVIKALKEAKVHTSWINPNKQYENAAEKFTRQILTDPNFLDDFLPFQKKIEYYGIFNSLAQTLLKTTCPGIPDFYQGSELWDLSLVDPDNRRPVDYEKREKLLAEVSKSSPSSVKRLLENYTSGKVKIYLIFKALQTRRRLKGLFEEGDYNPLSVEGTLKEHVFAFIRKNENSSVVVVVPRFLVELLEPFSSWRVNWKDTAINLPTDTSSTWMEVFTGSSFHSSGSLLVNKVLEGFPVALLVGGDNT